VSVLRGPLAAMHALRLHALAFERGDRNQMEAAQCLMQENEPWTSRLVHQIEGDSPNSSSGNHAA
jgi:hypothetical protein